MDLQPQPERLTPPQTLDFAEPPEMQLLELPVEPEPPRSRLPVEPLEAAPLELLPTAESGEVLAPALPTPVANTLQSAIAAAETYFHDLATVNLKEISDQELQPARIQIGLAFVGFGALMLLFLLIYFHALHPELNHVEQLRHGWYQYIWFVGLGVAGMMMLGREAMRGDS